MASTDTDQKAEGSVNIERKPYRFLDSVKSAIFVVGSAVVLFVAFRNTLTWHTQYFWGASGDLWQSEWEKIYDWLEGDDYLMGVHGVFVCVTGSFWIINGIFMIIDLIQPSFLMKYKVQDNTKLEMNGLWKAVWVAVVNQTVIGIPVIIGSYKMMVWRGCDFGRQLPTFHWVVLEMIVFIWMEEMGFYYTHRLGHHPKLYKSVHKFHHEWTAPIGLIMMYAHPIETVFVNSIPMMIGPLICGSHIATVWLWLTLGVFTASNTHSGYHFPLLPSPEAHDFHHLKFTNNFGVLGVLDRLHGTDSQFRKTKQYQRHFMLLSTVSIKQIIPDQKKDN